jgi:methylamine utilization protein MauE
VLSGYLLMFCRWSIGLTFLASAAGKAWDLRTFRQAVVDLTGLPAGVARPAALATVAAEALVVLGLAVGHAGLPAGFALATVLLLMFSGVLIGALRRKVAVSCNCFGARERSISWYDVARNVALLACCGAGEWSHAVADHRQPPATGIALTGLMACCFCLIVTNAEDIVEVLRKPYLVE